MSNFYVNLRFLKKSLNIFQRNVLLIAKDLEFIAKHEEQRNIIRTALRIVENMVAIFPTERPWVLAGAGMPYY